MTANRNGKKLRNFFGTCPLTLVNQFATTALTLNRAVLAGNYPISFRFLEKDVMRD